MQWIGEVATALGHDWADDGVRRVAQRALVDARRREQACGLAVTATDQVLRAQRLDAEHLQDVRGCGAVGGVWSVISGTPSGGRR